MESGNWSTREMHFVADAKPVGEAYAMVTRGIHTAIENKKSTFWLAYKKPENFKRVLKLKSQQIHAYLAQSKEVPLVVSLPILLVMANTILGPHRIVRSPGFMDINIINAAIIAPSGSNKTVLMKYYTGILNDVCSANRFLLPFAPSFFLFS